MELLKQIVEDELYPAPREIIGTTAYNELKDTHASEFERLTAQILIVVPDSHAWKVSLKHLLQRIHSSSIVHYDIDVCFISALRTPEQAAILQFSCDWQAEELISPGIVIRRGQMNINGEIKKIVSAHCNQMGFVTSALTTQILIHALRPRLLLMNGVCGAMPKNDEIHEGDIVIADISWDWQCGKWLSMTDFESAPDQKSASIRLVSFARNTERVIEEAYRNYSGSNRPVTLPAIHVGPMVSGSAVVATTSLHSLVKSQHRKAIGLDMECYGVYLAAGFVDGPLPEVLCVKGISDLADPNKKDKLQDFCSYLSARVLFNVIESYFTQVSAN